MEPNKDKKLYLLLGVLVIAILVVLRSLIVSSNDAKLDYDEVSGADIIITGQQTSDRETYYIIEGIFSKLASAHANEYDYSIEDYYEALNESYKNHIGKSAYIEKMETFFGKLEVYVEGAMEAYVDFKRVGVIKAIYKVSSGDDYVCVVGRDDKDELGYLGITLNRSNNTYEIFYIE